MPENYSLSRRRFIGYSAAALMASTLPGRAFAADPMHDMPMSGDLLQGGAGKWALAKPTHIRLAVNLNAICLAPVVVADQHNFFKAHNLEVEFVNFGNSTELLLESIATGKAEAAIGMALRWLKALEQGFDVKLTAGTHGGCMRLLARDDGPSTLEQLKGKTIGVTDMAGADKNFFSLMLKKHGIDPNSDVNWRVFPQDLLPMVLQKGEIQAASGSDPIMWRLTQQPGYREIGTNLMDEYAKLSCCVVGTRGSLIREQPEVAAAITHAILQAHAYAAQHPEAIGGEFNGQALNTTPQEIASVLKTHTHGHYSVGNAFVNEIDVYARDLKAINVLRPETDPLLFARGITSSVLV
ncbi:ABC transporter substrate-binding protein [Pantoea sp. Acro-805]|uniref:ABC transporter substrate-binding protein n=1 Tax=Candidatus Pantoea formicae TaxID=2608355 RepID=A0ABX0QUK5_9GAMM|nr:ABC transporter substrate-binding protein [Pantoea formicae]MDF7649449.1 ABC transporter substrate-binding protein [Erwiniaceae bacterium L1_54_3]NIE99294.1 ABC transporter substrate-binding protein [Pantoea formicae]